MFRKLACAMVVMVVSFGFVLADEFRGTITKVEGDKVTVQKYKKSEVKGKKGEKDGDPVTLTAAKDVTVAKGKSAKGGKVEAGDKIEDGLKSDVFTKIGEKGVNASVTTEGDKITQILVIEKK